MWGCGDIFPLSLNLGTSLRQAVSFTPRLLHPRGKTRRYPSGKMLGGTPCRYETFGEEKNLLPLSGIEPRFIVCQGPSLVTIATEKPGRVYE